MKALYPLRFAPIFRQYLWGGRRLATMLGKDIGEGTDFAESWEVVDHGKDQSVVQFGHLAGQRLHDLVSQYSAELFGSAYRWTQFPLLFKFLDANRDLSVQVHPNDAQGALLDPPDLGKTEAWVVLAAELGSTIYAGLRQGVTRRDLVSAVENGTTETCLHQLNPQPGDCVFIPAGTVHALGAGLLIAEIQQASDTTFRLFDWNRVGLDGNPRELHVSQALDVIDFERGPVSAQVPTATSDPNVARLVECDKFVLDHWVVTAPKRMQVDDRCHLLAVLSGSLAMEHDPSNTPLRAGQTMLIPASVTAPQMTPHNEAVVLDIYVP